MSAFAASADCIGLMVRHCRMIGVRWLRHFAPAGRSGTQRSSLRSQTARRYGCWQISSPFATTADSLSGVNCLQNITARKQAERHLLNALPAAIYTTDADGCLTFFNEAAVQMAGRRPTTGEDKWCVSWRMFYPDGRPMAHNECPMAITLNTALRIRCLPCSPLLCRRSETRWKGRRSNGSRGD
jgi:PAS domain-containing protein